MNLKDRLRRARLSKGWTQADLARESRVSQQAIQHLEIGRSLTSKYLSRIASALQISVEWLETGQTVGALQVFEQEKGSLSTSPLVIRTIPIVLWQSVGQQTLKHGKASFITSDIVKNVVVSEDVGPNCFGLIYKGEPMNPPLGSRRSINDGDTIIVNYVIAPKDGNLVLVRNPDWDSSELMQYTHEASGASLLSLKSGKSLPMSDSNCIYAVATHIISKL